MLVEVLKSFKAGDATLSRGDVVDAGKWSNLGKLISARFVRPAEDREFSPVVQVAVAEARETSPSSIPRRRGRPSKAQYID